MTALIDMTGKVIGRWTVLERSFDHGNVSQMAHWRCECTCGRIGIVIGHALRRGLSNGCTWCAMSEEMARRIAAGEGGEITKPKWLPSDLDGLDHMSIAEQMGVLGCSRATINRIRRLRREG